jgi:hypothetical protein
MRPLVGSLKASRNVQDVIERDLLQREDASCFAFARDFAPVDTASTLFIQ